MIKFGRLDSPVGAEQTACDEAENDGENANDASVGAEISRVEGHG